MKQPELQKELQPLMNNQKANNNFAVLVFIAGIFLLALLVGNAIGSAISHDDVASFGDFYNAMGGWEAIARFVIGLVLIIYSVRQMKRLKNSE